MTITFDEGDRQAVAVMLKQYGLHVSEQRITNVLENLEVALQEDCYREEMKYMIEEFEVS